MVEYHYVKARSKDLKGTKSSSPMASFHFKDKQVIDLTDDPPSLTTMEMPSQRESSFSSGPSEIDYLTHSGLDMSEKGLEEPLLNRNSKTSVSKNMSDKKLQNSRIKRKKIFSCVEITCQENQSKTSSRNMKSRKKVGYNSLSKPIERPKRKVRRMPSPSENGYNNEYCDACNTTGDLLCCDGCPRSFHFTCVNPPIDRHHVPSENWYCNSCKCDMDLFENNNNSGLFGELFKSLQSMNPLSFSLPEEIKSYFEDVKYDPETGDYVDGKWLKEVKFKGEIVERDLLRLVDSKGKAVLCFTCGQSAVRGKQIISCDFCPLHWHLDCLNPPLICPPPCNKKWMCPNHVDHLLPKKRFRANSATRLGVENDVHHNYPSHNVNSGNSLTVYKNDGYIDVELEENNSSTQWEEFFIRDVHHRLPEKGIKLQFIDTVLRRRQAFVEKRAQEASAKLTTLEDTTNNLHASTEELTEWLTSLVQFQQSLASHIERKLILNGEELKLDKSIFTHNMNLLTKAAEKTFHNHTIDPALANET